MNRIEKHGRNMVMKRGPKMRDTPEMMNFLEQYFIFNPTSTFKKAYNHLLEVFNYDKSFISEQQLREVFKKSKNFSNKKVIPIKIAA